MQPSRRPFQDTGVDFLASRDVAFLLDDAGLGKSRMVLDAAERIGAERILILGPAVAGASWPVQVGTWAPHRTYVSLKAARSGAGFFVPKSVYFVSYDALSHDTLLPTMLSSVCWDLIVLDEAQYLKNPAARRTQSVYGEIVCEGTTVWVLSGTLAPNDVSELYTHLRALLPDMLADLAICKPPGRVPERHEFEDRFCQIKNTPYGRAVIGSQNIAQLRDAMAPHVLRRRKEHVLPELPALDWQTAPLAVDPETVWKIYADAMRDQGLDYDALAFDLDADASDDADPDYLKLLEVSETNLAAQRRVLGLVKVPGVIAWVKDRLYAGDPKIILFAHHRDVLSQLYEGLAEFDPVIFTGATPTTDRINAVARFQDESSPCRVFIGQIQAAGTAITLTAAKCVFFAEYAGTPGVNYQAASRAHRLGQQDGVQAYLGCVPGSLDDRIARTAARRARDLTELFG